MAKKLWVPTEQKKSQAKITERLLMAACGKHPMPVRRKNVTADR